eukprot:329218-Chlamydomonas_euryale.AAC.1
MQSPVLWLQLPTPGHSLGHCMERCDGPPPLVSAPTRERAPAGQSHSPVSWLQLPTPLQLAVHCLLPRGASLNGTCIPSVRGAGGFNGICVPSDWVGRGGRLERHMHTIAPH